MDFSEKEKAIIVDLINIAWNSGAVRSPQMGGEIEKLRLKLLPVPKEQTEASGEAK